MYASENHMCALCLQRSERGIRCPGSGVRSCHMVLETEPRFPGEQLVLLAEEPTLQLRLKHFFSQNNPIKECFILYPETQNTNKRADSVVE